MILDMNPSLTVYRGLRRAGIDFVASVPCVNLQELLGLVDLDPDIIHLPATREEEGVGICAGAWMGGRRPALLMQNMNLALYPHLKEQFITAAYCVIDCNAGKIRIAQAGHPPIYMLRRGEQGLLRAKPKGRFFGFDEHLKFDTEEYELRDFQRIFLYSDGVIEAGAIGTSPYSAARLEDFLLASKGSTADGLLKELERDIVKHTNTAMNTDDDSSCVVVDLLVA